MVVIAAAEKAHDFFGNKTRLSGERFSPALPPLSQRSTDAQTAVHPPFTGMDLRRLKNEFRSTDRLQKIAPPRASCSFF